MAELQDSAGSGRRAEAQGSSDANHLVVHTFFFLTRFNKIVTQGAPQMAVDKEANSLSRVYSYYSKFNLRLFYV